MFPPIFILRIIDNVILYPTIALYNFLRPAYNFFRPYPYEDIQKIQYPEIRAPIS